MPRKPNLPGLEQDDLDAILEAPEAEAEFERLGPIANNALFDLLDARSSRIRAAAATHLADRIAAKPGRIDEGADDLIVSLSGAQMAQMLISLAEGQGISLDEILTHYLESSEEKETAHADN